MVGFQRVSALAAVFFLGAICTGAMAQQTTPPAQAEIHISNERWQPLPENIRMAYVGPDGRQWFVTQLDENGVDPAAVHADIEQQWSARAPILHTARPALFEKTGRIWFITGDGRWLLAYDGKTWIDHPSHAKNPRVRGFIGDDPQHGRVASTPINLDLGGIQVFAEGTGFSAFDGTNWIDQEISPRENGPLALFPETDGKSALAIQASPAHVWRFADGKWAEATLGIDGKTDLHCAAPTGDGALFVQTPKGGIARLPLDGSPAPGLTARMPMMFDDVDINKISPSVVGDALGNVCIAVLNRPAAGVPAHSGIYILRPTMPRMLLPTDRHDFSFYSSSTVPMFLDGGKTLWLSGNAGAQRFDLSATPPKIIVVPDRTYAFVQAVAPDGTAFISVNAPFANGHLAGSRSSGAPAAITRVMVFKPLASDHRPALTVAVVDADLTPPVLEDDGLLWCSLRNGVRRFDGSQWTTVHDHFSLMTELYAGANGRVLMWQGKNFALMHDKDVIEGTMLDDLIKSHPAEFSSAFDPTISMAVFRRTPSHSISAPAAQASGLPTGGGWSIATDAQGHIWMTISHTLRVLDHGQWINVPWPEVPVLPDKQKLIPGPSRVFALGDGTKMLVLTSREVDQPAGSESKPTPPLTDYVASFKDGKAELQPLTNDHDMQLFEDADRTLWYCKGNKIAVNVVRVKGDGSQDKFTVDHSPMFCDRQGLVWLSPVNETFKLLKDCKPVGDVNVPGADATSRLYSDKPNSVWIWTTMGLQHLIADSATPENYKVQGAWIIQTEDGQTIAGKDMDFGISSKGFFYAAGHSPAGGPGRYVYTGALPTP